MAGEAATASSTAAASPATSEFPTPAAERSASRCGNVRCPQCSRVTALGRSGYQQSSVVSFAASSPPDKAPVGGSTAQHTVHPASATSAAGCCRATAVHADVGQAPG